MDSSESLNNRWWNEDTVAVVTGANKGIGYAIVRQLAEHGIRVILTARDEERGKAAAKSLNDEGFHNVVFHQVDVQDERSIHVFANWMKEHYGKLDILVNNAAVLGLAINYDILKAHNTDPSKLLTSLGSTVEGISESYEMAKECIDINYYGTKRMVKALLPLLKLASKGGGRIVNVSSCAGVLEYIPSETLRQQLSNLNDLTEEKIAAFLESFLKDFQQGLLKSNGWPISHSAYFISKAALNAYTRLLALQHSDLYVNCVHPGFVKTDLNFNTGWMSIDEGAKGPIMLALLPPGSPSVSMATKNDNEETHHNSTWALEDRHFPNDVALHIASMLKVPELCALGSSSVFWRDLCASDLIWSSLARKRWPCLDLYSNNKEKNQKMPQNAESPGHSRLAVSSQGWRAFYIKLHAEMAERAHSLIELVKQSARYESLEVGDYQRAMEHLHKTKMGFEDVQLYLLTAKHSVLVNLIGLHYCLAWLGIQTEYVKEALAKNQIADKHICLRWWSLGQWVNGFRRGDEMHVCIAPLSKLLEPKQEQFLYVIQRGAIHEVLRVQISADFRTSAWIARDMHSQR